MEWLEFTIDAYKFKIFQICSTGDLSKISKYLQNIEKISVAPEYVPEINSLLTYSKLMQFIFEISNENALVERTTTENIKKEAIVAEEVIDTPATKIIYEPFVRSVSEAPRDKDSFKKIEAIINAGDHASLTQLDQKLVQKYFKYKKEKIQKQQV
ncbi:hypothetical protein [Rickettsia helvetica]|uniref:Uncharacterized protein n=1 Tax=Rickettsia helvetica TaxID=35789 RepID=A0ABP0T5S3_RICHE|nr:hypothetical protein [Rickettsia helvetica]MCZ6884028.1 hypothetical protein [Rickettsia endosymbiont of Ixodes ricinus]MCZ6897070.1 hypothetical protein [Rickettsia endosymbiont of Ixodes ricinus]